MQTATYTQADLDRAVVQTRADEISSILSALECAGWDLQVPDNTHRTTVLNLLYQRLGRYTFLLPELAIVAEHSHSQPAPAALYHEHSFTAAAAGAASPRQSAPTNRT